MEDILDAGTILQLSIGMKRTTLSRDMYMMWQYVSKCPNAENVSFLTDRISLG